MKFQMNRSVLKKDEGRLTVLQIIGFWLVALGIIAIIAGSFFNEKLNGPSVIAVAFFITMLGFSFCFPSLFKHQNKGLSTMRITVFMMTNVICMLLLKIGFASSVVSLAQIGLNQWWMGVIAFIFGAKATQSFFESKMAVANTAKGDESDQDENSIPADNVPESVLIEAIEKNDTTWKKEFNVKDISVGVKKINGISVDVNCLVFKPIEKITNKDLGSSKIPSFISFKSSEGKDYNIPTDVQKSGGLILPNFAKANENCDSFFPKKLGCSISRSDSELTGTIGMKVFKNGKSYILGCYHVLCAPELDKKVFSFDPNNPVGSNKIISPSNEDGGNESNSIGSVSEGSLDDFSDSALVLLDNNFDVSNDVCRVGKKIAEAITIDITHVKAKYPVLMSGRTSKLQKGKIKSSYTSADITYQIGNGEHTKTLRGLICASIDSDGGDSGGPIVDEDNNAIGIVVASSPQETYIIPVKRLLTKYGVTLK